MKLWSLTSSLPAASALSMWGAATAALPGRFGVGASRRWWASTDLVAPGGVLVVIGLARPDLPKDIPVEVAAQFARLVRPEPGKTDGTPRPPIIWPPPERYATMRRLATELLPGVRWHRHLRWRYSLVWARPSIGTADPR
jgi:hypothetical protein